MFVISTQLHKNVYTLTCNHATPRKCLRGVFNASFGNGTGIYIYDFIYMLCCIVGALGVCICEPTHKLLPISYTQTHHTLCNLHTKTKHTRRGTRIRNQCCLVYYYLRWLFHILRASKCTRTHSSIQWTYGEYTYMWLYRLNISLCAFMYASALCSIIHTTHSHRKRARRSRLLLLLVPLCIYVVQFSTNILYTTHHQRVHATERIFISRRLMCALCAVTRCGRRCCCCC